MILTGFLFGLGFMGAVALVWLAVMVFEAVVG